MKLIRTLQASAFLICAIGVSSVIAAPPTEAFVIAPAGGNSWRDTTGDMVFTQSTGDAPTVTGRVVVSDLRPGTINIWRSGLDFNVIPLLGLPPGHVRSAVLQVYFSISRDLNTIDLGPPTMELLGYYGDGFVSATDVLQGENILEFVAFSDMTVELDVTDFVTQAVKDDADFAGFVLRIEGDYVPGTFSDAIFPSRHSEFTELRPRLVVDVLAPPGKSAR